MQSEDKSLINYLKAFAIILVIFGHAAFFYRDNLFGQLSLLEEWIVGLVYTVHVPLFFVISGYLCHPQNVKEYFKKKFVRVLIPFYWFTVLKLLYSNLISSAFSHHVTLSGQLFDAFVLGRTYWFAYAIVLMYLVMPLVWAKDVNNRRDGAVPRKIPCVLLFFLIINQFISVCEYPVLPKYFQLENAIKYFPFFLTGYLFSFPINIFASIKRNRLILTFLSVVYIVLTTIILHGKHSYIVHFVASFALMILLYRVASSIQIENRLLLEIGKYSWQLMLFDSFYKVILFKVFVKFATVTFFMTLPITIINIALGLLSCYLIKKVPSRLLRELFGLAG